MSKEPIISFVIPVYNKPPEIFRGCLKSLHDQSVKEIEILAVFDGENAELLKVAEEFPKVQTLVIPHGGGPKARNAGLEQAKGKYVWFWDADCRIKPDHAKRMLEEFDAIPDADFVYSGFELADGGGTMEGESFNRYSLECGNYISSMAPIKREKAFQWDESLEAGQDWDYWLTATEKGLKGVWVEGTGFITDTYKSGLSSNKWSAENRENTIYTVRHKHGIPDREMGVFTIGYKSRAIKLAQVLGADLIKPTGLSPTVYKSIFNLGYNPMSRFEGIAEDVAKIQYWIPGEIEGLRDAKYQVVMETIRVAKKCKNLCNTDYEKNKLEEMGIQAEVVPLPLAPEDISKVSTTLPEKFAILVDTDEAYGKLLKDLPVDLPHIKFIFKAAKTEDYSCFMSFHMFSPLDNAITIAHANGRNVISNVQAPFCGFVDPDQNFETFKKELYGKIAEAKALPFNKEAQDYYLQLVDPEKFKQAVYAYTKKPLEVL